MDDYVSVQAKRRSDAIDRAHNRLAQHLYGAPDFTLLTPDDLDDYPIELERLDNGRWEARFPTVPVALSLDEANEQ